MNKKRFLGYFCSVQKVGPHGIQGMLTIWIKNWLVDRRQKVMVKGCFVIERLLPVTTGISSEILAICYMH